MPSGPARSGSYLPLAQYEPVDRLVEHPPDEVLADAVAAVSVQLVAEVVAGAAGGHLGGEFRSGFDVIVLIDPGLSTMLDHQANVGLWLIVHVETNRGIVRHASTPGV